MNISSSRPVRKYIVKGKKFNTSKELGEYLGIKNTKYTHIQIKKGVTKEGDAIRVVMEVPDPK